MLDSKIVERKLLLKRLFPRSTLFQVGKTLDVPYFRESQSAWDLDEDRAALEITLNVDDEELEEFFRSCRVRSWEVFRGQFYTFEKSELRPEGSWNEIRAAIAEAKRKYGSNCVAVLQCLLESGKGCSLKEIKGNLPEGVDPTEILLDLEEMKVIVVSYKGKQYYEWGLLEETLPAIRLELGLFPEDMGEESASAASLHLPTEVDPMSQELRTVEKMDGELDHYLLDLLKHRVEQTVNFGRSFSIANIGEYLKGLFGPLLFFDSLLSITQQYGLADVEIVHAKGRSGIRTGWNLSLFGEPGTGKSFSTRDIILGKPDSKVAPHGIPGRNRYAGGITPARFIRMGQAYSGRVFNFIVPEFNEWFKYKGMVEPLKLAMERGEIKYEMYRETIGPYRFSGFFSVNYNVATLGRGYEITVQDPNFVAIEDRMLCRLHRLTKQRFVEIADSQMRLAFGEIDIEKGAQQIRDHLSLVYAIETEHPLVRREFRPKPVMLTPKAQETLTKTRRAILEELPRKSVRFSARLEDRAIRFACAASLVSYFQSNLDYIPIDDEALKYAMQLYVEEASVRSHEEFAPELVLAKLAD